ncbi:RNA polymerase sigma factor [Georhizobium sp. MAB10]|uniref:RNA polymerase sigma factor n=1 Tax=Georhizobium sp. MAB10 TaxID=3028319 RepID=UPI00385568DC
MTTPSTIEGVDRAAERVARSSYGKLIAILTRRDKDIAAAEDALSEALVAALQRWPVDGVPNNPEAWLITAARNRLKNRARAHGIQRAAEPEIQRRLDELAPHGDQFDERLSLMFLCAHPAIDIAVRTPLILQVVLGIDAGRIARAFLVEPTAMSQRLVRAKARIRDAGLRYALPEAGDMPERLGAVLDAIYAAFGQGWDRLDGLDTPDALTGEAIWLARLIVQLMPDQPEPKGLLALMLYCAARQTARRDGKGRFVPLDQQDPRLWDRNLIIEAEGLLMTAARAGTFGRFQCEAAIQSVHIQRPITGALNLAALRTIYDLLIDRADSIAARIGRAVVIAEAGDPTAALAELDTLPLARVRAHQPWWVARSHVSALAGLRDDAVASIQEAIALTEDEAVRAHLIERHERLAGAAGSLDANHRTDPAI